MEANIAMGAFKKRGVVHSYRTYTNARITYAGGVITGENGGEETS